MGRLKKDGLKLSAEIDPESDEEEKRAIDRRVTSETLTRRMARIRRFPAFHSIFRTLLTVRCTFTMIDLLTI